MKQKKDVLFLCQFFYPEYVSSATLPFDTAVALSKAGFSVGALCGYPVEYNLIKKVPKHEYYENIEIKRLQYIHLKRSKTLGRLINYFSFTLSVALHFAWLRNYKTVIVYSNPPVLPIISAMANKFFKTKVVFVCFDVYPEIAYATKSISQSGLISKIMKVTNKIIYKRVSKVVALSTEMKKYLLDHRPQLTEQQVEVIPNWTEDIFELNKESIMKNELYKDIKADDKFVISYFGNMGICQDLDTIIEAIRVLKDDTSIKFVFAGHGSKYELLKGMVKTEKINNVSTFDFLIGEDFQAALYSSNCFVISLVEGLSGLCVPSKTYSYMMAGKPIIAIMEASFDVTREIVKNHAGYALRVGDVAEFVRAVKEMQSDGQARINMSIESRNLYLGNYTQDICTNQYIALINKILKK